MGNCCCSDTENDDIENTYDGPIGSTRSSSLSSNVITTTPALNLFNDRTPILSKSASDRASIRDKPSTDCASSRLKAVTDNTTRTPGYGATSSKTNRERSMTRRDNNKTLPYSDIYPTRSTRSSSPSLSVNTTLPILNLSNDIVPILSKTASDRASICAKPSTDRASIRPKDVTDNTTRTPGYDATSSKANRERSRTRRDNNKTLPYSDIYPTQSTRSSSPSSSVNTIPILNLSNDIALSKTDSDRASICAKPSTDRASIRPKDVKDNTTRTPGYGATSSKTNRERSRTRRDNNKTLPYSDIYPTRCTRSSSPSLSINTTLPILNLSNDIAPILSKTASDRASICAKPALKDATDNTTRTPGYGAKSSETNRERSRSRRDNNKTPARSRGHSSSSRTNRKRSKTNRERSRTRRDKTPAPSRGHSSSSSTNRERSKTNRERSRPRRDNNKTLPYSGIYPTRSTRSSSPSSNVITTPTLNLSNARAPIRSTSASDITTILGKASTTPGYGATNSQTNWERSLSRRDNNKTPASPTGHSSSSRTMNQHSSLHTNRTTRVPVPEDPVILTQLLSILYNFNINLTDYVFQLESLREESWEYQRIKSIFFQSNRAFFKLHSIDKVHNPYLLVQYGLKKYEYIRKGIGYRETLLFHGTKREHIGDICRNNFNWRLQGTNSGSRYGQGVNFASVAYFAALFCDEGYNKVMIIANVLIRNSCRGNSDMAIPPCNFDSSTNDQHNIYVKYDDNTFYPAYIIHFGGIIHKKKDQPSVSE
ncbi:mucin-21-like [Diabrotica virgifera virgifera]|uniref:Poly [ADP-ribose] polymerase n=1 Tax=Diabrotica virgifera virgifera TaxID=50390 RepID=A0ABM5L0J5_DIAVI|nr:mucin-21-like [Diabrotica virgifera virgifera]XP_050515963.1 mucin-21-like [Diabrotica virgifera virgifera]